VPQTIILPHAPVNKEEKNEDITKPRLSKLPEVIVFQTCMKEVPSSNLDQDTDRDLSNWGVK
jgi:hypothetical protein